jgi:hypothetical protein
MINQLKELSEEAVKYATAASKDCPDGPVGFMDYYTEKFAELVVSKSIEVMMKHDYHGEWLGEKLKEHFGMSK